MNYYSNARYMLNKYLIGEERNMEKLMVRSL
jgi:hypothetical protein